MIDADVNEAELCTFVSRLTGTLGIDVAGVCSAAAVGLLASGSLSMSAALSLSQLTVSDFPIKSQTKYLSIMVMTRKGSQSGGCREAVIVSLHTKTAELWWGCDATHSLSLQSVHIIARVQISTNVRRNNKLPRKAKC